MYSSKQTVLSSPQIEGIILGAGEKVDEVAGGASCLDVDRISEIGDRAREGQVAGVYGVGFTVGSLARKGARDRTRGMGKKFSSDMELMEFGRMAEAD